MGLQVELQKLTAELLADNVLRKNGADGSSDGQAAAGGGGSGSGGPLPAMQLGSDYVGDLGTYRVESAAGGEQTYAIDDRSRQQKR